MIAIRQAAKGHASVIGTIWGEETWSKVSDAGRTKSWYCTGCDIECYCSLSLVREQCANLGMHTLLLLVINTS